MKGFSERVYAVTNSPKTRNYYPNVRYFKDDALVDILYQTTGIFECLYIRLQSVDERSERRQVIDHFGACAGGRRIEVVPCRCVAGLFEPPVCAPHEGLHLQHATEDSLQVFDHRVGLRNAEVTSLRAFTHETGRTPVIARSASR